MFFCMFCAGVSGVICTCAAGVTVAWLGPPLIIQVSLQSAATISPQVELL